MLPPPSWYSFSGCVFQSYMKLFLEIRAWECNIPIFGTSLLKKYFVLLIPTSVDQTCFSQVLFSCQGMESSIPIGIFYSVVIIIINPAYVISIIA
jgi:hypothetical protein